MWRHGSGVGRHPFVMSNGMKQNVVVVELRVFRNSGCGRVPLVDFLGFRFVVGYIWNIISK